MTRTRTAGVTARGTLLGFLSSSITLLGLYLLLAGEISRDEVFAGVPVALAVSAVATARRMVTIRAMRFSAGAFRLLFSLPLALAVDCVRVGAVLIGAIGHRPAAAIGAVARQPFRQGSDDPSDRFRRALVTLGSSLAPNGYVLDIGQASLVLHRLVPSASDLNSDWPS